MFDITYAYDYKTQPVSFTVAMQLLADSWPHISKAMLYEWLIYSTCEAPIPLKSGADIFAEPEVDDDEVYRIVIHAKLSSSAIKEYVGNTIEELDKSLIAIEVAEVYDDGRFIPLAVECLIED